MNIVKASEKGLFFERYFRNEANGSSCSFTSSFGKAFLRNLDILLCKTLVSSAITLLSDFSCAFYKALLACTSALHSSEDIVVLVYDKCLFLRNAAVMLPPIPNKEASVKDILSLSKSEADS